MRDVARECIIRFIDGPLRRRADVQGLPRRKGDDGDVRLSHRRGWDPRQGPGGHVRPVRSKVRRHSDHIRVHEGGRRFGKRREVSLFTSYFRMDK